MRSLPNEVLRRLSNKMMTRATNSDPSAIIWISRTETPLTDSLFLEQQEVLQDDITDISVAVCHPRLKSDNTHAYVAYISNGTIKVSMAILKTKMYTQVWKDTGVEIPASAVSIAFDGTMPKNANDEVEFVTDLLPWVFFINEGALYGQPLNGEPVLLVEKNCTDVSAVRAMWSSSGSFDFGMVVFFIMEGKLYYRQKINGEWMDAELISFGPNEATWKEIASFRTLDYRIGLQARTDDGIVYELVTQFMGVGKQNTEHINIRSVKAESDLIGVSYHNTKDTEHVELADISAGALYGGLYSLDMPNMASAHNIADENDDWGKLIVVTFDVHLNLASVAENATSFTLVDSNGAVYMASEACLDETGKTVTLQFTDFNAAKGVCSLVYTPGTLLSMASVSVEQTQIAITPDNLVPPEVDPPMPVKAWNTNTEGTEIAIEFTESLAGDIRGNEDKFEVVVSEYDMVPDGTIHSKTKSVTVAKRYTSVDATLPLNSGNFDSIMCDNGKLRLCRTTEVSEV